MADEIQPDDSAVVAEATTPAEVAVPKKRGPRAKKVASDVASEEAIASPKVKRGRKPKEMPADLKAAEPSKAIAKTRAKGVAKATGKRSAPTSPAEAPVSVLDEMADLLQLEEENARLRKALAEKLRAENADLRKRLGLA
ncbi:SyrB-like regulator [Ensifer sp. ENS12]|uniref:SyrB-like regulator n=1 Tax=Ensifer sp. ENS12 TaxID=2854774 RepID=UPI000DE28407|nr:SyrB-like regulator [Ensifer sp. ENS12]MBV7518912.1 SyrB-like regulator [Ensifer sp. ENS12]